MNSIQEEEAVVAARSLVLEEKNGRSTYGDYRKRIEEESKAMNRTITENSYKKMIDKFSSTFDTHLKQFMTAIKTSHYVLLVKYPLEISLLARMY